jgi:hypothetical protein
MQLRPTPSRPPDAPAASGRSRGCVIGPNAADARCRARWQGDGCRVTMCSRGDAPPMAAACASVGLNRSSGSSLFALRARTRLEGERAGQHVGRPRSAERRGTAPRCDRSDGLVASGLPPHRQIERRRDCALTDHLEAGRHQPRQLRWRWSCLRFWGGTAKDRRRMGRPCLPSRISRSR